jgi:hypothetical protein
MMDELDTEEEAQGDLLYTFIKPVLLFPSEARQRNPHVWSTRNTPRRARHAKNDSGL